MSSITELYELLSSYYEHLYQKVLHYNNFIFKPSNSDIQLIGGFIDYLDMEIGIQSIGEDWVFNFIVYSFKERIEQKTRFDGKKIPLNWIMGKKAFELYEKRNENWLYFNGLFISKYNIQYLNLNRSEEVKTDFFDSLRKQYYIEDLPISYCLNTVSFNSKSKYCLQCKSKNDCKLINK